MTTGTLGTNANNSLTGIQFGGAMLPATIAAIANAIKNEQINGRPIFAGAFAQTGRLYIPNRGVLSVKSGDWVGVDSQGWPILVSANSIANGPWSKTGGTVNAGTLGTNANNTLTSKQFVGAMVPADIAAIANAIKGDGGIHLIDGGAWSQAGFLRVPGRGNLTCFIGDYVGVDSQGWPVLISKNSIANGPWTHVGG